jgi:enoyl-[acyl-carrier-protein] reductase (NADH)
MNVLKMFDLSGKVAVITGAGNGLGHQIAEAMAEAGADVVCADIDMAMNEAGASSVAPIPAYNAAKGAVVGHRRWLHGQVDPEMVPSFINIRRQT